MKLHYHALEALFEHRLFLESVLPSTDIFFVWWAIRNILLGKTIDPNDIDCTCVWNPELLRKNVEKYDNDTIGRFRTEKFGTISLIKRTEDNEYMYELTPFRTEWTYTDVRHPDQLERSDSLLADSKRRDFTINCLYWHGRNQQRTSFSTKITSEETALSKQWAILVENTLIIRNQDHIESLTAWWAIQQASLQHFLDQARVVWENTTGNRLSIIFDAHWWINDLTSRTIVTVWDPFQRFEEDALRVMRWARFVITLNENLPWIEKENCGFDFRRKTRDAMVKSSHLVKNVSFERIQQEMMKVFSGDNPFGWVSIMSDLWLIEYLFPALHTCVNNTQPTRHHPFDTYSHILLTVHAVQQINKDPLVKIAMLYHDVGKPEQYDYMEKAIAENPDSPDRSNLVHHADISVIHLQKELKRLCFPKKDIETIARYVKRHHRPWEILAWNPKKAQKKLRLLLSEWWIDNLKNLLDIAIADRLWQFNPIQTPAISELQVLKEIAQEIYDAEWRFTMKELVVNGSWVMEQYDIQAWPELWVLLSKIFERVIWDVAWRNMETEIKKFVKGIM